MNENNDTSQQQSNYRRVAQPHEKQQDPGRAHTALRDDLLIAMRQLQQFPIPVTAIVR